MAYHYKLIASVHNKMGFYEEYSLEDYMEKTTRLEDIDRITCCYSNMGQLLEKLDQDGIISGKNWLSIAYQKENVTRYLPVLFQHPEMLGVIQELKNYQVSQNGHLIQYRVVDHNHPYFREKFNEFLSLLGEIPEVFFAEIYDEHAPKKLEHYVMNYYQLRGKSFDTLEDEYEYRDLFDQIKLEFSRYSVFREYIIAFDHYLISHPNFLGSDNGRASFYEKNQSVEEYPDIEEFLTAEEIEKSVFDSDSVWYRAPRGR